MHAFIIMQEGSDVMTLIRFYDWLLRKHTQVIVKLRAKKNKHVEQMIDALEVAKCDIDLKIKALKAYLD